MSKRDKELEKMLEMLKELNKMLENVEDTPSKIQEFINRGHSEEAEISIHKYADGRAETGVKGSTPALLVALAGLEHTVLEKLDVPAGMFELVKRTLGTREISDEEE